MRNTFPPLFLLGKIEYEAKLKYRWLGGYNGETRATNYGFTLFETFRLL